ncbi:MAG: 23S rRNA (uracil(1939)-C(5))-methyltransferase RlmD [Bacteroidales bacterium]|nr:23S rRNA (uracil(1939)-C(5))-methyltransferase RlmD [Bacteroidales bacterium]
MGKIKRGDILKEVEIVDLGSDGKAVGKKDGLVFFVKGAVPGDITDVLISKSRRSYNEGEAVSFLRHSPDKIQAKCSHFGVCGGCKWQNLTYEKQLYYKQKSITEAICRIGKIPLTQTSNIIPSENIYYYRNKLEFTFSNKRWLTPNENQSDAPLDLRALGFHVPGLFNKVVDIQNCYLQNDVSNRIRNEVSLFAKMNNLDFFDIKNQTGFLRNLIIRNSNTGELMVIVVFYYEDDEKRIKLLEHLSKTFHEITSLMYVINPKKNDTINDLDVLLYKGRDFMSETMENLTFRISAKSFFQTNSAQAYILYKVVRDFAQIKPTDLVYDLYTGTGSIALFLASDAKKIVGIEYIEQAIENAKENAQLNNLINTVFVAGVIEKNLNDEFIKIHGKPDVLITDPPRSGMHPKVITQILDMEPKSIVYVSCNPSTQARDIALLSEKYTLEKLQAVDMFPHTSHVESVGLMRLINNQGVKDSQLSQ